MCSLLQFCESLFGGEKKIKSKISGRIEITHVKSRTFKIPIENKILFFHSPQILPSCRPIRKP